MWEAGCAALVGGGGGGNPPPSGGAAEASDMSNNITATIWSMVILLYGGEFPGNSLAGDASDTVLRGGDP
jgi:hypothetical protein